METKQEKLNQEKKFIVKDIGIKDFIYGLLIQRRSSNKDVYPSKLYVSVAGHPVSGEDELEGIKREALEEIGKEIDTSKLEYLFTFSQEVIENNGRFLDNMF